MQQTVKPVPDSGQIDLQVGPIPAHLMTPESALYTTHLHVLRETTSWHMLQNRPPGYKSVIITTSWGLHVGGKLRKRRVGYPHTYRFYLEREGTGGSSDLTPY